MWSLKERCIAAAEAETRRLQQINDAVTKQWRLDPSAFSFSTERVHYSSRAATCNVLIGKRRYLTDKTDKRFKDPSMKPVKEISHTLYDAQTHEIIADLTTGADAPYAPLRAFDDQGHSDSAAVRRRIDQIMHEP